MKYKKSIICAVAFFSAQAINGGQQILPCSERIDDQRYTIIRSLINNYKRPFTTLDIGADNGYCSLQVAHDYNAVCVMVEEANQLLENCKAQNELTNIVLLKTSPTVDKLRRLSECEHFDVVFAFNVLREFGEQWREALSVVLTMGDHIIVEVPSKHTNMQEYVVANGGEVIGKVSEDHGTCATLYVIESSNCYLQRKTWLRSIMRKKLYRIESSFAHKLLIKPASKPNGPLEQTSWIPGINLCTFKMCYGAYPTSEQLKDSLLTIKDAGHTDWLMNNMIVQGATLALIDCDDEKCKCYFSAELLQAHNEMLDFNEPQKIEHYFWNKLIKVSISTRQIIKFFNQLFPVFSLVFDIGSSDKVLINRYLGYGSKVICCNPVSDIMSWLHEVSKRENIFFADDAFSGKEKIKNNINIDDMIECYGLPRFCNIHLSSDSACASIKTLSQRIDCISYKFDIRCKEGLTASLSHLASLGYSHFNFSVRDIPSFILENNRYIGIYKKWANSVDDLLCEIDEFAQLDHDGGRLWGYIYARYV